MLVGGIEKVFKRDVRKEVEEEGRWLQIEDIVQFSGALRQLKWKSLQDCSFEMIGADR